MRGPWVPHVDWIELNWIDLMLRDRIQSKLQLNLPDLNLLIRKGWAEVGAMQSIFKGRVPFNSVHLRTSRGWGQQSTRKQRFPAAGSTVRLLSTSTTLANHSRVASPGLLPSEPLTEPGRVTKWLRNDTTTHPFCLIVRPSQRFFWGFVCLFLHS